MAITDPRDIPGLLAWYSAEAETGYSDGAIMSGWSDQSGNSNDAISASGSTRPTWQASDGPGSGPAVKFPRDPGASGGYFVLPNMLAGLPSAHILVGIKADPAQTSVNGHWTMSPFPGGNDGNYYPHAGIVYESFGLSTNQRQNFTPTLSITSWRTYDVWSTAGDWGARLDGTTQATYASGTPAWVSGPLLGRASSVGIAQEAWKGWMAWVVILDHKATATEYADLVSYFTANPSGGAPTSAPTTVTGTLDTAAPAAVVDLSDATRGPLAVAAPPASVTSVATAAAAGPLASTAPAPSISLTGSVPDISTGLLNASAPAALVSLAGLLDDTIRTDVANDADGRQRSGAAVVDTEVAVVPLPAHLSRAVRVDKALAYPTPTLVDGRPE